MAMSGPGFDEEVRWLRHVLTGQIPLGTAMALEIERLDEGGIALLAPLAPNVNDKGTAFGGALVSLMILAGWSLPRLALRRAGLSAELVIGRCEVRFLKPVAGAFRAECDWPPGSEVEAFVERLTSIGRGRLELAPRIVPVDDGEVAARLQARYAALGTPPLEAGRD
jgi:thioesterase domain-containing protein